MKPILLSDQLTISHDGKAIDTIYRAMLVKPNGDKGPWLVSIEQPGKDQWHVCGRWHLKTLLFGYPNCLGHKPSDRLSIDHGSRWQVESGMHAALQAAIDYI